MENYQAHLTRKSDEVPILSPLQADNLEDARKESLELAFHFGSNQRHPEPIVKIDLYTLVLVDTINPQEKWTEFLEKNNFISS